MEDREQTGGPGPEEIDSGGRAGPAEPTPAVDVDSGGRAAPSEPTPSLDAGAPGPPAPRAPSAIVDGEDHHVDPRSILVVRLIAIPLILALALPAMASLTLVWAFGPLITVAYLPLLMILLSGAGLVAIFAYVFPAVSHRHLRYRVDPDGLRIQRGVFWRKTIWIPITRVQHTDVSQGPLQRQFELATLTVHTAGTQDASIQLSGLQHGVATRLSDHLRPDRERDAD